jgi:membrane associated rhomboid family serine protease
MIPAQNTVPYRAIPWVSWCVTGLCLASFAYQLLLGQAGLADFFAEYALVPARFTSGEWARAHGLSRADPTSFLTSMFLHAGFLHILFNLWTLWVFAPALEDRMGATRFALLYLASGLAAGLVHVVFNFHSDVPTIGASGAIAGIIAAYARRFPYAWVNVLQPIFIVPAFFMMPALMFAGLWFLSQVMQAAGSLAVPQSSGIAWWAHIGGFVAGWLIMGRTARERNAIDEAASATQSALWPMTTFTRWTTWWWRRR